MSARRIVLIRHAEKPSGDGRIVGVAPGGHEDEHELSVRGWQRAGALARFFAPGGGDLGVPDALFAAGPSAQRPSRRPLSTLMPLAARLQRPLDCRFGKGEELALADAASRQEGLVLVSWDHRGLGRIAQALAKGPQGAPADWSDDCFDRFWIFTRRDDGGWDFESRGQRLLEGDLPHPASP
ncbi:hypothetical protein LXT12_22115 [Pelomonas sp. P7]|uniref:Broad specificity phosphatase PhoE n=1 Tax=Pelomonas caseinilytica TaxID=2906763 RepID=A0ABS8XGE2_9BURK|nr:hypothetical protein [Pelomonas sp. P7]MCE4539951.1 hypothetical protein [Pelomonas sp. P7]